MKAEDSTWGFGANLGILQEPSEDTRIGLTCTSPVKLDLGDVPEFTNLGPGIELALGRLGLLGFEFDLGMKVPQTVMTGFVHRLDDRWALLGNVGRHDWSPFGKVDVQVGSSAPDSLTVDGYFKDAQHAAVRAETKTVSLWAITFGAAHDSSCVDDVDRTPSLLVGEDWRLGVGGRRAMSDRFDLAIAYELVWAGDMPVYLSGRPRAGDFVESYEGTAMHFLSASLRWKL